MSQTPKHPDNRHTHSGHPPRNGQAPKTTAPVKSKPSKNKITPEEHRKAVKKKRTFTSALILAVVVLLIMCVTAASILYVTDYVAAKPNYSFISEGSIEHSVSASGLIIRDETTDAATTEGTLVSLATEGSRVAKGEKLAMIIPENMKETSSSLRNVQIQIVELQRKLMKENKDSGAEAISIEADNSILPIIKSLRGDATNNRLGNVPSYSGSIQVLMDKRDADLQNINFKDEQLSTLIGSKQQLEATLADNASTLVAAMPGIVSYKLDDLCEVLNTSIVTTLTFEQYSKYIESAVPTLSGNLAIKQQQKVLRICQNEKQYFAAMVPDHSVLDFQIDSKHSIRVPAEGVLISDCMVKQTQQVAGGVFVVFETRDQVERLLDQRQVELEVILDQPTTGLRVSLSSLVNADYKTGYAELMVNSSGYARKLVVTILDWDREYAIIQPVKGFDAPNESTIIITNPQTVSDGSKLE